MHKLKTIIFSLLLLGSYSIYGTIIHIDDIDLFEKVVGKIDGSSLVLFDVDYTLIMPRDVALGPRGKEFTHKLISEYLDNPEVIPSGKYPEGFLFGKVLTTTEYIHVDRRSVKLVHKLQREGIPVLALTAAETGPLGEIRSFADFRVDQLKTLGFDFKGTYPDMEPFQLTKNYTKKYPPAFKSGVLFASKHPKGEVLKMFFTKTGFCPKKIIFVDDRMDYINSVEKSMNDLGIECICLHYTAADKFSPELDAELAAFQFQYLADNGEWLPDEQARTALLELSNKPQD